jgi:hypothetical protein
VKTWWSSWHLLWVRLGGLENHSQRTARKLCSALRATSAMVIASERKAWAVSGRMRGSVACPAVRQRTCMNSVVQQILCADGEGRWRHPRTARQPRREVGVTMLARHRVRTGGDVARQRLWRANSARQCCAGFEAPVLALRRVRPCGSVDRVCVIERRCGNHPGPARAASLTTEPSIKRRRDHMLPPRLQVAAPAPPPAMQTAGSRLCRSAPRR